MSLRGLASGRFALVLALVCAACRTTSAREVPAGLPSALLEQRQLADDTHHCPHGRPTALLFSRHDLERQFRRV